MRSWWGTTAAAVATTALGLWFALRVPLGLPYDEPAHWGTVLAYASGHRLPVLGDPGVPYEAQMGPVYYTLAAVLLGVTGARTSRVPRRSCAWPASPSCRFSSS